MTTESRLLTVPFTVPEGFSHTWLIACHLDLCALTGVQGDNKAMLTTGRMEGLAGQWPDAEMCFAKSCFQDWLAEAIGEMGKMCREE